MNLVSVRIISADVARAADFYENVTGGTVVRPHEQFAEVRTDAGTLAIGSIATVDLFGPGSARANDNHTAIIEFLVDDVDAEYVRLREFVSEFVGEPTVMPWGNKSLLFRDPDGNLVNFFTPTTPEARAKFARWDGGREHATSQPGA
ncbi:VOC family protein [Spelaeicoccus albus]|uniref:Catechol 2,3-dioxygenase-like lactoylglutathione lyase family enzyme n=1 Tax=Spelaeicoccus albus TaxID=1280376 RepID=A0A7Z0IJ38_9MICO|nr:VOC family protein [Spelaeicoccus albus]NYI69123.1 catechol 2,3-dioxygenase-like lactoylglutathione lyase family enzyme [Spelaeicoccus albus]